MIQFRTQAIHIAKRTTHLIWKVISPGVRLMFGKPKSKPQQVTNGRFEIAQDGRIAYLEYNLTGKVLQLIHSEVPEALRGHGMASELAKSALDWARENGVKVDVVCPSVAAYIEKHPEYSDLLL
jgi:predicted GNAT family acetyltransferase